MDRLAKIERILALQGKIHRLAEWRLGETDRKQSELSQDRTRLIAALNDDGPLYGLFVDAMARRLAALARESDRLGRVRDVQQRRLQEEGLRLKRFEHTTGRLQRDAVEAERKREFAALLDTLARLDDASLP